MDPIKPFSGAGKGKPGFWCYLKSMLSLDTTSEKIVKCRDGRRFYRYDTRAKLNVVCIYILILAPLCFIELGHVISSVTLLTILFFLFIFAFVPLTYLFAKFVEIKDNADQD